MKEMPKYKIIENYIIDRIQSGDLKPGDQIETEKQLSEKFDIGRLTVNKALITKRQNLLRRFVFNIVREHLCGRIFSFNRFQCILLSHLVLF